MTPRRPSRSLALLLCGALLAAAPMSESLAQCAMCGSAAGSSPGVARGLAYSIFFLLGILGFTVGWLLLVVRRAQRGRETADDQPVVVADRDPVQDASPAGDAPAAP